MNARSKKITIDMLVDHCENRLSPNLAQQANQVVAADSEARSVVNWLRHITPVLRDAIGVRELNPSPSAVAAVQQMFRDRQREARPHTLPCLVARLVYDSRLTTIAQGVRGNQPGNLQVVYSTGSHDVDLWQERLEDGDWYLIGQILPKDGSDPITPRRGVLASPNDAALLTESREGEFFIEAAHTGRYDLTLELPDCQILMTDVAVGTHVA
jgi:hypothetical protein